MVESTGECFRKAAEGDADSFRSLLETYGPQVRQALIAEGEPLRHTEFDLDDVMQVTYLEAFLHMDRLTAREPAGFVAWLKRIAENNLRDAIKSEEREKRPPPDQRVEPPSGDDSYVALMDLVGATSTTPSRLAATSEARVLLDQAIERLPPDYALVIRSCELEGRPASDVALSLGRSVGAVYMIRARAIERLRDNLGSGGRFFSDSG